MLKLTLDFNNTLSDFPGSLASQGIATEELDFSYDGKPYHLTAVCRGKTHHLSLWDEWGEACPGFEVVCMGQRLTPEEGEDSIDLGERSWLELASLHLYIAGRPLGFLQIVPEMPRLSSSEKEFALEQRHAWQFFYQMRTCPPLEALKQGSEEAKRHLSACPSCRELLSGGKQQAWVDLAKHLASRLPSPRIPQVQPGQIWSLHENLEGWDRDGLYLRTPQVLILSGRSGIQVVPICSETILAGERDVFLSNEIGFAEAWNRLTLPPTSLRECWGSVDDARLQAVLEQLSRALPEAKNDLRHAFENLERHVADTVEKRALAMALSQTRKPEKAVDLRHWYNHIMEALRDLFPAPPLEDMAVAADDNRTIPLQFIEAGETKHHRAALTSWITDKDGIHVTGKLLLPKGTVPSVFLAWLERKEGEAVAPVRSELIDLYFQMDFPALEDVAENDLRLVAVSYGG